MVEVDAHQVIQTTELLQGARGLQHPTHMDSITFQLTFILIMHTWIQSQPQYRRTLIPFFHCEVYVLSCTCWYQAFWLCATVFMAMTKFLAHVFVSCPNIVLCTSSGLCMFIDLNCAYRSRLVCHWKKLRKLTCNCHHLCCLISCSFLRTLAVGLNNNKEKLFTVYVFAGKNFIFWNQLTFQNSWCNISIHSIYILKPSTQLVAFTSCKEPG